MCDKGKGEGEGGGVISICFYVLSTNKAVCKVIVARTFDRKDKHLLIISVTISLT